jgi:hypothetical protein
MSVPGITASSHKSGGLAFLEVAAGQLVEPEAGRDAEASADQARNQLGGGQAGADLPRGGAARG